MDAHSFAPLIQSPEDRLRRTPPARESSEHRIARTTADERSRRCAKWPSALLVAETEASGGIVESRRSPSGDPRVVCRNRAQQLARRDESESQGPKRSATITGPSITCPTRAGSMPLGYRRAVLDTLACLTVANALYLSSGLTGIEDYNGNPVPGARFFGRDL